MVSTRVLGQEVNKHHKTVLRTLEKHKYYSYKFEKHQELPEGYEEGRMAFCFEMMERANNDRNFLKKYLFYR